MPESRPNPAQLAARTLNRLRNRGPIEVIALAWGRVREGIASDDELVMFVRHASGDVEERADLSFRVATANDAARFAHDIGTESPSTFRARLSRGTRCYLVEKGSLIVHSTWATETAAWTREIRRQLKPPPGDIYVYESFTRPEVRGRGVYPFALQHICADAREQGSNRVWVAVEADNPASVRAVTKAGFTEAFRVSYRRRFGRLELGALTGALAAEGRNFIA